MGGSLRIIPAVLFILLLHTSFRQEPGENQGQEPPDTVCCFKGRIPDRESRVPVGFAHVISISRNHATICDTLGYFFLRVLPPDTLRITAIGFAPLHLPVTDSMLAVWVITRIDEGTDTLDMLKVPDISPVTALYNRLSKEGKEKRKYRQLVEQEQFEREIAYKYSPLIVSGITGYSGMELYAFMDFCGFSNKFLEESDRYRIRDAIVEKQKAYEKLNQE